MMKKFIVSLIAIFGLVFLSACDQIVLPTVAEVEISGQKTEFLVGDSFDKGELKVVVTLSDGTSQDVTAEAKVEAPESLDSAGKYAVVITYSGFSTVYYITVEAQPEPEPVLPDPSLVLDMSSAKLSYKVGEEFSSEGIKVYEVRGTVVEEVELSACTVKVADENAAEVTGAFAKAGKYSVEVAYNGNSSSYELDVYASLYTTISEALAAGLSHEGNVKGGQVVFNNYGMETASSYEFGSNLTMVKDSYYETYYHVLSEDSVFGVQVDESGNASAASFASNDVVKGADFRGLVSYAADIYGVADLLQYFYDLSQDETSLNYSSSIEKCAICGSNISYAFQFGYVVYGTQYKEVVVEFELSATETIVNASVTVGTYYSSDSLELDEEGVVVGLVEGATADYTSAVTVSQEEGERTLTTEHTAEKYMFTAYDVVDAEQKSVDGQTVEMEVGAELALAVTGATPETASSNVDPIKVEITDAEGNSTWSVYGSYYDGVINFGAYKEGTYSVVVASASVSKSFTLKVNPAELTEFNAGVYENYSSVATEAKTVYPNTVVTIVAIVNAYADSSFTAALTSGDESAQLSVNEYSGMYEFTASVLGTYVVTLTSSVDSSFTATLTLTVEDAPSVGDLLNGKYVYEDWSETYTYVITPTDEANGTCEITVANYYLGTSNYSIKYSIVNGAVVCTNLDGSELTMNDYAFTIDANMNLVATYGDGWEIGPLSKVAEGDSINGIYEYSFTTPKGVTIVSSIELSSDGTGLYNLVGSDGSSYMGTFTWTFEDGTLSLSNVTADEYYDEIALSCAYADGAIALTYGSDSNVFTLVA